MPPKGEVLYKAGLDVSDFTKATKDMISDMDKVDSSFKKTGKEGIDDLLRRMGDVKGKTKDILSSSKKINSSMSSMVSTTTSAGGVMMAAFTGIGGAIAAIGVAGIARNVAAMLEAWRDKALDLRGELTSIRKTLVKMGADTSLKDSDLKKLFVDVSIVTGYKEGIIGVAQAYNELLEQGYSAAEAEAGLLSMVQRSADEANAAMSDVAISTQRVQNIMEMLAIGIGDELVDAVGEFIDELDPDTLEGQMQNVLDTVEDLGPALSDVAVIAGGVVAEALQAIAGMLVVMNSEVRELDRQRKAIKREEAAEEFEKWKGEMRGEGFEGGPIGEHLTRISELEDRLETERANTRDKHLKDEAFRRIDTIKKSIVEEKAAIESIAVSRREAGLAPGEHPGEAPEGFALIAKEFTGDTLDEYKKFLEEMEKLRPKPTGGRGARRYTVEAPPPLTLEDLPDEDELARRRKERSLDLLTPYVTDELLGMGVEPDEEQIDTFLDAFYDRLRERGEDETTILTPEIAREAAETYVDEIEKELRRARAEEFRKQWLALGKDLQSNLADGITAALLGQKDAGQMFADMLYQMLFDAISLAIMQSLVKAGILAILNIISGGAAGAVQGAGIPGLQSGTPPEGITIPGSKHGTPVVVGENWTTELLQVTPVQNLPKVRGGDGGISSADMAAALSGVRIDTHNYYAFDDPDTQNIRKAEQVEMGRFANNEVEG